DSVSSFSRRPIQSDVWEDFSKRVFYQSVDATKPESYENLKNKIESLTGKAPVNLLFYLSAAPEFFGTIATNLKKIGLIVDPNNKDGARSAVVIEKPFGHDSATAKVLN